MKEFYTYRLEYQGAVTGRNWGITAAC